MMKKMMNDLFFIIGPAGTGKSTFLNAVSAAMSDTVGLVEVGKKMRAMFPPEYFKGSAAPQHTQALALQMFREGVEEHCEAGKQIILVDGQPRNPAQFDDIWEYTCALGHHVRARFIHLFTPVAVREERLHKRDKDNPKALELSLSRLTGDLPALYEVLSLISDRCHDRLVTFNTTHPLYEPVKVLKTLTAFKSNPFERAIANAATNVRSEQTAGVSTPAHG